MASQPIQIVDTNDRPIRSASKQEAWDKGLFHRVVRVMVEDANGHILLQHRSPTKDLFPNRWDNSAAGHVDAGEDYDTAARRELAEELGLHDQPLTEIGRYFAAGGWQGRKTRRFSRVYKTVVSETPEPQEPDKITEVRWFSLDEVKQLIKDHPDQVSDGLAEVIKQFYSEVPEGEYEPVVVVDDKDQVISNASLADARTFNLIYRAVFVIAVDTQGRVLLQKRSANMHLYPNCWDLAASGHVDGGRTYEQAAQLELQEEVGVNNAKLTEVAHFYTEAPVGGGLAPHRFSKFYQIQLDELPTALGSHEVSEVRWFTKDELNELLAKHPEQVADGPAHARKAGCL